MALRVVAARFRQSLLRSSSSSHSPSRSPDLLGPTEWSWVFNAAAWDGRQQQQQRRSYARDAAAGTQQQKLPTPNAAKNVKAKNATKKEEKKEQRERFNDLIDACLNARSPLSPLKEKDRLRLLERERLGVISQERLREIEQEKALEKLAKAAAKKKAAKDVKEMKEGKAKAVEVVEEEEEEDAQIGASVTRIETEIEIQLTSEEGKRLAKECSRVLLKGDRERAKGEAVRLQLKKEALAALPPHLREAALMPDLTPFPKSRIPASLTPPIKGYIEDRATAAAQAVTVKKSR